MELIFGSSGIFVRRSLDPQVSDCYLELQIVFKKISKFFVQSVISLTVLVMALKGFAHFMLELFLITLGAFGYFLRIFEEDLLIFSHRR